MGTSTSPLRPSSSFPKSITEDEAGQQLQRNLDEWTDNVFDVNTDRPVLRHLNADTSWLLSLPYPKHLPRPQHRCRFNIVIDAWLAGSQVDGFRWFSAQEHAARSKFQSLAELDSFLKNVEDQTISEEETDHEKACFVDAVFCSHEFTDHCHEATLKELPSAVPVFAPRKAASIIRSWNHFSTVTDIPVYAHGFHWRNDGVNSVLPERISVGRIHTKGDLPIHFHSALAMSFTLSPHITESIIYTPHGIAADSLDILKTASTPISVLALMHGLHDISLVGAQLNLGKENAIKARALTDAKYWLPTHDEVKIAHGIVATFLRRVAHTSALAPGSHPLTPDKEDINVRDRTFVDVKNGQSITLK